MKKYRKTVWFVLALAVAAPIFFLVAYVWVQADEVAACKWEQWKAGGKQQPEMDIATNVSFRREGNDVVVDFRKLEKAWFRICLTTFYAPGYPYLSPRDAPPKGIGITGSNYPRTRGCWAGVDPEHLMVSLTNRNTNEAEEYLLKIPSDFRDRSRGRVVDTDYRYLDPPGNEVQCTTTSDAVARCMEIRSENEEYCLPVFRR